MSACECAKIMAEYVVVEQTKQEDRLPQSKREARKSGFAAVKRQVAPFKRELVILTVLGLVSAASNGFVPYITGRFFDALIALSQGQGPSGDIPLWAVILGALITVQLIAHNIDWVLDRIRRQIDTKVHLNIEISGITALLRVPVSFHKNERINELLEKISRAGWQVSSLVQMVVTIAPQLLSILIGISLAATIDTTLAGILALGVAVYATLLAYILRPIALLSRSAHQKWSESWGNASAAVMQIESVKQAAAEAYEEEKAKVEILGTTFDLWYRLEKHWSNVNFFQRIVVLLTQSAVFILSVHYIAEGVISVGELVALNGYALMFFGPFVQLGHSWQMIQNGLTSAAQAETVFSAPREEYYPKNALTKEIKGAVAFEHVSFNYRAAQPTLSDIDFEVYPGDVVALVGPSGVGKSTAISLISGYYFPTAGRVLIDGTDTRAFELTALRKQIAVVPQEVALFNESIADNIRYGVFDASDDDIARAAKEAHIAEFIETLPERYDTLVGERGMKLSVGQKQRVAIARAILRNPKILILDEPTSALDAETERLITSSLEKLMRGRTTFIIAHRLSTVRRADKILVFEKGSVVERGKHHELIQKTGGVYRNLYEHQIGLHG